MQSLRTALAEEVVAMDGKALRRAIAAGQSPKVVLSAWAAGNGLVLGQRRVEDKSNEPSGARLMFPPDFFDRASAVGTERTANMPQIHRHYDQNFRQEAVNLLLNSGRPHKQVAKELGVTANSPRAWRDKALGKGRAAQAASAQPDGRSGAPLADAAGEIRRLQREVEYMRRQRESSGAR